MYMNGTEIANGYQEIQSANDYRDRFNTELNKRKALSKPFEFLDHGFLKDLEKGIPKCSGVAIGIERLYSLLSL
jgi:lysyl-tRNA synthetase class 2